MIEAEHPTEAGAPPDGSGNTGNSAGVLQQVVPQALMIALTVESAPHALHLCKRGNYSAFD
jgi:hypothetical protein